MNQIIGPAGKEWPKENVLAQVSPGWRDLVERLIDDLFVLGWDGNLFQIKEKFGGLRFYIDLGSDEVYDRITLAEDESFRTCETCGKEGKPRHGGWIVTLCDEHVNERAN